MTNREYREILRFPLKKALFNFKDTELFQDHRPQLPELIKRNDEKEVLSLIAFYANSLDDVARQCGSGEYTGCWLYNNKELEGYYHFMRYEIMQLLKTGTTPEMRHIRLHFKSYTLSSLQAV